MPTTHAPCREAVAAGDVHRDAEVREHLAGCSECQAFAAHVADLDRRAAAMTPPPAAPALADRVVAAIPARTTSPTVAATLLRGWPKLVALAAVVLLIAGIASSGLLQDQPSAGEPRKILLAAASHFEEDGAQEVTVEASSVIEVDATGRDADFSQTPPEVRDHMTEQWNRILAEVDRQIAEFEGRVDDMLSRFDESLDGAFGSRPGAPPAAPERQQPQAQGPRPAPPDRASLSLRIRAAGIIDATAGAQLEGAVTPVAGTLDVPATTTTFGTHVSAGTQATRRPDGRWVAADVGTGPLNAVLLDPKAIPSILRAADGEITVRTAPAGTSYDFRIDGSSVKGGASQWRAQVVVDENGRVRRMSLGPVGRAMAATRTELTLDIGGRATLDPGRRPAAIQGRASAGSGSPFAAIAPAVRAALQEDVR